MLRAPVSKPNSGKKHWLLASVFAVLTLSTAAAQIPTPQTAPTSQAATPDAKPITFEVISIRRNTQSHIIAGDSFTADGFRMSNIGVASLLAFAYPYDDHHRTDGLPDWCRLEGYDISAKVADADIAAWSKLDWRHKDLAIKAMLEDRFKLKAHMESREMPVYAIVVAKGGLKIKEATPGDTYPNGFKGLNGQPLLGTMMETSRGVVKGQAVSMTEIANAVALPAGRPGIDKTGLTGKYDLTFTIETPLPPATIATSGADSTQASDPSAPFIFSEVQDQLGLKLEPAKAPMPFLVIDHIERPTEN